MTATLFDPGREGILRGEIRCDGTSTLKMLLVRSYTLNLAHKFVSDMTGAGGSIVATSPALTTITTTAGVLDFDPVTWSAVAAGAAIPYILLIQSSAVTGGADVAATAQRLIAYEDSGSVAGLPVTPNGNNIVYTPDSGANAFFKL